MKEWAARPSAVGRVLLVRFANPGAALDFFTVRQRPEYVAKFVLLCKAMIRMRASGDWPHV
jgi:hypothetical protein